MVRTRPNFLSSHRCRNHTLQGLPMQSTLDPAMKIPVVYNDTVVRRFAIMTVIWGIVGMLVGVVIAADLIWPNLNFGLAFLSYRRLRPLHTNAVIFAFGGSRGLHTAAGWVL